jgi:hypothetical protein
MRGMTQTPTTGVNFAYGVHEIDGNRIGNRYRERND